MRRRTHTGMVVPLYLFVVFPLFVATLGFEAKAITQAVPEFKVREAKLKDREPATDIARKEKNSAKNSKEKADLTPIEGYYRDYLIPLLTQPSPEAINIARREFIEDLDAIEKNKELLAKFNTFFLREMREVALKGADGKTYCPATRVNAAVLLSRLNSDTGKPFSGVHPTLLEMITQKENDALIVSGLFTLNRHLKIAGTVSEAGRSKFAQTLQGLLTTPAPLTRDLDAHNYLMEQVIECLTELAKTDTEKDSSKTAVAALSPALVKIIDEQKSEWLVEVALNSLGTIKTVNLTEEDSVKLEKALAKFIKQSIKDWKKRILNSAGGLAAGGMGGMGMGSGSGSGSSEFSGGGPGRGGRGGGGPAGGGSSGEGSGSGFGGGVVPTQKPKRPFEDQPKEVKNARRIAHQRFERIHMALDGIPMNAALFLKKNQSTQPAGTKLEEKGLLSIIPAAEKEKVVSLLASVEAFQKELNDEKVADLSSLTLATTKSVKQLRADCDLILGETKVVVVEEDEALVPTEPGK